MLMNTETVLLNLEITTLLPINEVFVYSLGERLIQYNIQVEILYHIQGSQDQGC